MSKMSEVESKFKEENEIIKDLFNLNDDKAQIQHLKEFFPNIYQEFK